MKKILEKKIIKKINLKNVLEAFYHIIANDFYKLFKNDLKKSFKINLKAN